MRQNLQGHISEIAKNYQKEMYYIHRPNLAKHIGNGNSLHNWCKKQVLDSSGQEFSLSKVTCSTTSIKSMTYQEDCQCKFSFILSKTLQVYKTSSFSWTSDEYWFKACSEIVHVIVDVIVDCLTKHFECNFITATTNTSETHFRREGIQSSNHLFTSDLQNFSELFKLLEGMGSTFKLPYWGEIFPPIVKLEVKTGSSWFLWRQKLYQNINFWFANLTKKCLK